MSDSEADGEGYFLGSVLLPKELHDQIVGAGHELAAFVICAVQEKLAGPTVPPKPTVLPDMQARFLCAVLTEQRNEALDRFARARVETMMLRAGVPTNVEQPAGAV